MQLKQIVNILNFSLEQKIHTGCVFWSIAFLFLEVGPLDPQSGFTDLFWVRVDRVKTLVPADRPTSAEVLFLLIILLYIYNYMSYSIILCLHTLLGIYYVDYKGSWHLNHKGASLDWTHNLQCWRQTVLPLS